MKLSDYLHLNGIQMSEFAASVGTTSATICRIINQRVVPRRGLMEAIHRETEGRVTPNDLIQIYPAGATAGDLREDESD